MVQKVTFFERQDRARRQTWLLLFYLVLAVVLIAVGINVATYGMAVFLGMVPADLSAWLAEPWWPLISLGVLVVVIGGSFFKYLGLRDGGRAIAAMMGARLVDLNSRDPLERRLVNVVEEMSIASGTPVPVLYVLDDEDAINAFVAGYRPTEAVMVVTRGALDNLDRDELQGVVGHEYSHILNGDMRINVRLMAVLAGILLIGSAGAMMLRSTFYRRSYGHSSSRSSSSSKGQAGVALFGFGLVLLLVGYIGLFFGRLIKAAVSRQREFLADASAVQFTRNPGGIAGALWRIGEMSGGATLRNRHAEDTSHMCFGESVTIHFLSGWLSTHPPIEDRVLAIDPHYRARVAAKKIKARQAAGSSGGEAHPQSARRHMAPDAVAGAAGFAGEAQAASREGTWEPQSHGSGGLDPWAIDVSDTRRVVEQVGRPQPQHMDYAVALHDAIPAAISTATHVPELAVALVYSLLVSNLEVEKAAVGFALVSHRAGASTAQASKRLHAALGPLDARFRLPLLELTIPALKRLPDPAKDELLQTCDKLVRVDRSVSVFEFALLSLLRKHLDKRADVADRVSFYRFKPVLGDLQALLSLLCRSGASSAAAAHAAFSQAIAGFGEHLELLEVAQCTPDAVMPSLERLSRLAPLLKQPVLEACTASVIHDGRVTVPESELLRAIAGSLDCPMPPMVASRID